MKRTTNIIVAIALAASGAASGACNDTAEQGIENLSGEPTFAVGLSDYESAGVALLDGDGKVLSKKYISSGSALPGLSNALHGDIALPTQPCEEGILTVVARSGGDYILQVDLADGKVIHQIPTQGSSGEAAFSSNPQDILCLGDGQALVSRFSANLDPKADKLDLGDDILRIDLNAEKRKSRIDLSQFQGKADGFDMDGNSVEQIAYARPGSMVRVGDHAAVSLARLTDSYTAAEGMLAILDLNTDKVTGIDLPKLSNCAVLVPVAGRDDAVIVSCAGSPYGDRASAGLAFVSVAADGKAKVEHTYQADKKLPVIYAAPVSIGGTRVVAVATGDFTAMTPDTAYVIDLDSAETSELLTAGMAGDLGVGAGGAYRVDTNMLIIPDASEGIHVFKVTAVEVTETDLLEFSQKLPVRGIRPLVAL